MKIYFRTQCQAILTDHWSVEAPPNWPLMNVTERSLWLEENIENAEFLSQEKVHNEGQWSVLDYHASRRS